MRASLALLALLVATPAPAQPPARNAHVNGLLSTISTASIEARIRKLASFRTRHTLSRTDSATEGIGAARRWIKAELEQCSRDAGGRLRVELDSFIQQPARRVPQPVEIVNVVATLPGTQPQAADRIYVVSGHYDSMPSDVMDPQSEAPGANDDASGTAVSMELACAMAYQRYDATLVFMAVAGEEQGLLGSAYLGAHPPVPIGRLAANINIDELGIWGRTRDLIMIGKGKSTLDTVVEAIAAAQGGRRIVPDANTDKGYFYRSDQFNLAKRGVPAAYLESGVEVIGKPEGWGAAQHAKYEETDYHQPSDELRPDWDFSGAVEDTQLLFYLGVKVAEGKNMPSWNPG
ncbi:MAG TPA: M28 family peptidase, partial [Burkholderiales bacterium]|nr:M28 family peptidase [Burkholderiales bacterium]